MNRKITFAPGEYYHLYHRGNDKRQVFLDNRDHWRLLALLYLCNNQQIVHLSDVWSKPLPEIFSLARSGSLIEIGAYCLMLNHFHLLVREKEERGISRFMQKVSTAYSMYFNKKYQRTGGLFERPFKAEHVAHDRHLQYLFAYIHLNPVKSVDPDGWAGKSIRFPERAEKFLHTYRFSSLPWYRGEKHYEGVILTPEVFPPYFKDRNDFSFFLKQWIEFKL